MKIYTPDYYDKFKCIAGNCKHSCCVGWEIVLDPKTYKKYKSEPWLNAHIAQTDGAFHIVQDSTGRCPFLNKDNLCDIILKCGEEAIGQICTDHPRFRHDFETHTEMGLGLCCEAACALILQNADKVCFSMPDMDDLSEREQAFYTLRSSLLEIAQDRTADINERFVRLQKRCNSYLPALQNTEWANVFRSLERLDSAWDICLNSLAEQKKQEVPDIMTEQLLVYFLYRHLPGALYDGRFIERILFCILSAKIIYTIAQRNTTLPFEEIARMYSSEIEYSEENTEEILILLEQ